MYATTPRKSKQIFISQLQRKPQISVVVKNEIAPNNPPPPAPSSTQEPKKIKIKAQNAE